MASDGDVCRTACTRTQKLENKSSVYDCTVEDVEYIYNKLSVHIFNSKSRRYLNVGITFP